MGFESTMNLPSGWYVICEESELSATSPNALRRFGEDWVAWKTPQGDWVLQADRCPHRSARLSDGWIADGCVVCPFHGFRYSGQGECTLAPEIGRAAPGLKVQTHPLRAQEGFLWLKVGEGVSDQIPWFEDLPSTYAGTADVAVWNQHFTRCVENQLDYSHLPFVHRKTIGRGLPPDSRGNLTETDRGLKVSLDTGYFEFRYPNIWRLYISAQMNPIIAFVPVDETTTRIYLRTYQNFVTLPGVAWLVGKLMRFFNRRVLREDQRVVAGQVPMDTRQAHEERLFPSDVAIQAFRRWLNLPSSRST